MAIKASIVARVAAVTLVKSEPSATEDVALIDTFTRAISRSQDINFYSTGCDRHVVCGDDSLLDDE